MYKGTKWLDRVEDADTGEVLQEGTNQSAGNFNNMEGGIADASTAAALLLIAAGNMLAEQTVEELVVELTNSASYPFNNSQKTVSMKTRRTTTYYIVEAEVVESDGEVGNIIISDKLVNGFKVRYDGSAKSATIRLIIRGGM